MAGIAATLARCWLPQRFPETEGYRCDLREVGPQGFSLPWSGRPVLAEGEAQVVALLRGGVPAVMGPLDMADQLTPLRQFEYLPGMNLRVLDRAGEPWFFATDVCKVLEHSNVSKALQALDPSEKGLTNGYTHGGSQRVSIISESGLYLLVLKSRKVEAKAFQKWVTGRCWGTLQIGRDGHPVGEDHPVIHPPPGGIT